VLGAKAAYYLSGDGSLLNWALYAGMVAAGALVLASGKGRDAARWMLGPILILLVPTAYFLTHPISTPYYQFPTVEMALLALAAGAAMVTSEARPAKQTGGLVITAALLLVTAIQVTVAMFPPKKIFSDKPETARKLTLPDEVKASRAWVLADRYSGTLWLTHGVYAMNMTKADAPTRAVMWDAIKSRGGAVYVVDDRPTPEIKAGEHVLLQEARTRGGKVEVAGEFEGAKVWRVTWEPV
jgi:hypothetical protein